MNSRERVLSTLGHKEPDAVPLDIGGTNLTGIAKSAYKNLCGYLNIDIEQITVSEVIQQLAQIDETVASMLKTDVHLIAPGPPSSWDLKIVEKDGRYRFTDEWGITWHMPKENGLYFDMVEHPLDGCISVSDVDKHRWPDPWDEGRYAGLWERLQRVYNESESAIVMQSASAGFFELSGWLRGMENFFIDLVSDSKMACKVMDKALEFKMAYWEKVLTNGGKYIQVVQEAEDLAAQNSLLISPELYRKHIKSRQKELYGFIKKLAPVKLFLHSCGAIRELIPDFIETGVDIINPVQVSARDMDTKELKKEFGMDIVFWGGGVDTQRILPQGTANEIRDEVRKRMDDLKPGGGFVFSAVHNIQADVPPQNIMAMWEAFQEYKHY